MSRLSPVTNTAPAQFEIFLVYAGHGYIKNSVYGWLEGWDESVEFMPEENQYQPCDSAYDLQDCDDGHAQQKRDEFDYFAWLSALSCPQHGDSRITLDGKCTCGWAPKEEEAVYEQAAQDFPGMDSRQLAEHIALSGPAYEDGDIPF